MGVQIATVKKFFFLRQVAEGAKRTTSTLKEALIAAQAAVAVSTIMRGRLVVSQSGSGQSGSFEIGVAGKEWTQDNIAGLTEELIWVLDRTVEEGTPDSGTPDTTDALFAAMCENINAGNVPQFGVTQVMGDWTGLNFPATTMQ